MAVMLEDSFRRVLARFDELGDTLASGVEGEKFVTLSKEYAELEPVVGAIRALDAARREYSDLEALMDDPATDSEMRALAEEDYYRLKRELPEIELKVQVALLPKDADDDKSAILEVRAGTGGDEAALFAADLFAMYQRYAALKGWRFEVMEASETGIGGLKEGVASINGNGVFARLKFESGVHRVQRVPETENSGRIHTSAATVAVLPEAEDVDVDIN